MKNGREARFANNWRTCGGWRWASRMSGLRMGNAEMTEH
jgi:hypothetical protein